MDFSSYILAAVAGLSIIAIYLVFIQLTAKKKQSEELTKRITPTLNLSESEDAMMSLEEEKSETAVSFENVLNMLLPMLGKNVEKECENLRPSFMRAGIYSPDGPIYYLFFQWVMSGFLLLIASSFFLSNAEGSKYLTDLLLGLIISVIAIWGPKLYIKNKIDNRMKLLQRSFPDMLDLFLVCVESGLAMDAALARVCSELGEAYPAITEELNRTRLELSLLNDRPKALQALGDRTDLVAFKSLAAALIQTEKFGTNLTDTLRVLADDYRQTRLLMAENKAGRLPALITLPLILMLMPAFMLVILGPAIVRVIGQGGIFGNASN